MRRRVPIPVAIVLLAAFAITVGGQALAYFAGPGSGTAKAEISKLPEPAISAATAGSGGVVTLTWGAVTAPGSGAVSYFVTRDNGEPAGNCPTEGAPTTLTTCVDEEVPIGEHSYRVVAEWHSWSAKSAVKTAKVTVGEAVKFTITGSTTTPATGGAVNLTITAKDEKNTTVTGYKEAHQLVFSGAAASPGGNVPTVVDNSGSVIEFGKSTALKFTNGVASVSSSKNGVLKVYDDGPASITATEEEITTPTPLALTVKAAATKFVIGAANATPAAGASDDLTITAEDLYGNVATSYAGAKSLVFSGANTSVGGNAPTVTNSSGTAVAFGATTAISFTAGVADPSKSTAGTAVLYKAEAASVKASEGSITTPSGASITPTPGAATKLALTSSTATPTAGTAFNLTTTAQDTYGNTATSYSGTKNITFSGASASPSGASATIANSGGTAVAFGTATGLSFVGGTATPGSGKNGVAILTKAGATSVTASDGTLSTPSATALTVAIGAAKNVAIIELVKSAGTPSEPCYLACTVSGLGNMGTIKAKAAITDTSGNVISGLGSSKTVTISSTGGSIAGSPLTVPGTGSAVSSTQFTYTAPSSGNFSNTITIASSGYTSAKITASK